MGDKFERERERNNPGELVISLKDNMNGTRACYPHAKEGQDEQQEN